MKRVIIMGSSGMIGGLILAECLRRPDVAQVTVITRKHSGLHHDKLVELRHQDFLDFSGLDARYLQGQDVCFYCVGVYTGQVPADKFREITVDYTRAFSEALKSASPGASFCLLSGQGADPLEKSRIMFARDKGIAENALLNLHFPHTYLFRPGYIYPVSRRKEPNLLYSVLRKLYKPLSIFLPRIGVPSDTLARKMVEVGLAGGEKSVYEHRDLFQ